LFHGLFDFCIFAMVPLRDAGAGDAALLLILGPIILTYLAYRVFRGLQRTALADDNADPSLAIKA
jgi:hypothetical protein